MYSLAKIIVLPQSVCTEEKSGTHPQESLAPIGTLSAKQKERSLFERVLTILIAYDCCQSINTFSQINCSAGKYSGSVVKTKIQAFYNEPIYVAELGKCPH